MPQSPSGRRAAGCRCRRDNRCRYPSGNVHAAAECNRQVGVVAAHPFAFLEGLPGGSGRSGVLIAERNVPVDVVADGLDAAGARRRHAEQVPRNAGQPVGFAVAASQQEYERLLRECFHRMLVLRHDVRVGQARVLQQRAGREAQPACWRDNPGAPVAKRVSIGCHRDERLRDHPIGDDEVAGTGVMDVQHQHHRRRLWTVVNQFVTNMDLHDARSRRRSRRRLKRHMRRCRSEPGRPADKEGFDEGGPKEGAVSRLRKALPCTGTTLVPKAQGVSAICSGDCPALQISDVPSYKSVTRPATLATVAMSSEGSTGFDTCTQKSCPQGAR